MSGGRHDACSGLLSEVGGACWPHANSPPFFRDPSPSAGGNAHRPLTPGGEGGGLGGALWGGATHALPYIGGYQICKTRSGRALWRCSGCPAEWRWLRDFDPGILAVGAGCCSHSGRGSPAAMGADCWPVIINWSPTAERPTAGASQIDQIAPQSLVVHTQRKPMEVCVNISPCATWFTLGAPSVLGI